MKDYYGHLSVIVTALVAALLLVSMTIFKRIRARKTRETFQNNNTIFVSVPAYRDKDCMGTLHDIFAKAKYPDKVFVGACVQSTGANEENCLPPDFKYHSNVRIVKIPHTEAQGPTYARALCAKLYRDEMWFLAIDSHTKFAQDWDSKLVTMATDKLKYSPKPVISHYPPGWDSTQQFKDSKIPVICKVKFSKDGVPALAGAVRNPDARKLPYVAGGFMFAPGSVAKLFDDKLKHLWIPEEFLLSARLYTNGYDVYAPTESVAYHFYTRKGAPRWHQDVPDWHAISKATVRRVMKVLDPTNTKKVRGVMGMGTERTLQEYYNFAGIDWTNRKMKNETLC